MHIKLHPEILKSTYSKQSGADVNLDVRGCRVQWMIDVVCDIASKSPIIRAIFKEIANGHCCMGETMNENSLQKPLRIMTSPTGSSDTVSENNKPIKCLNFSIDQIMERQHKDIELTEPLWHMALPMPLPHKRSMGESKTRDTQLKVLHTQLRKQYPNQFEVPSPLKIFSHQIELQVLTECPHLSKLFLWAPVEATGDPDRDPSWLCGFET